MSPTTASTGPGADPGAHAEQQPVRRRDAARSRDRLLRAAMELFAERGFDRTTIREIGDRAGVDPALIARYFGGKTQLYLAALRAEHGESAPADLLDEGRLRGLFERIDQRGPGPVFRVAVVPGDDPAVQQAAAEHLDRRLVGPLRERFAREGVERPGLRAELAVAAFGGVVLARSAGALGELAEAGADEVIALLREVFRAAGGPD